MKKAYVAVDFGGGSGRVIAAMPDGQRLILEEIHRFPNRQVTLGSHIYWDFPALFEDMMDGLRKVIAAGYRIVSVGIDTWGVDFGLIDANGNLLSNPVCYRDPAATGGVERYFSGSGMAEHYAQAGIQIMDINTLYRLADMKKWAPGILSIASRLLFMPDLFSYFLDGNPCNEYTIASTSELIDVHTRQWNRDLIRRAGLPEHLFGPIVMPGKVRGQLTEAVKERLGIDYDVNVVAVGSHDTASAAHSVAGTYEADGTAFLSSGTWSLLGVILDSPVPTEQARLAGFTNEGAVNGKIKFLQNITGLWILQRLIDSWKSEGLPSDYDYLLAEAEKSQFDSLIDVDHPMFASHSRMDRSIRRYCETTDQLPPAGQGDMVRCVLRSLAERYRRGIEQLNSLLDKPVRRLQIIGGGSRNSLLNRLTREATGLPVEAGPVEATAIGNVLMQVQADSAVHGPAPFSEIIFN